MASYYLMPASVHDPLVSAAFSRRGYDAAECEAATRFCRAAARHGIRTHNAIKALSVEQRLGAAVGGCQPGAVIERLPARFSAVQRWNANRKLGMAVAFEAMAACMKMADMHGVGCVAVDNAFHYLWGGGYVLDAADAGYIAYTCCTSALATVVPFGGKSPTLGTNPHSWAFPTRAFLGFNICVDWATSVVAMGRVQQFAREGRPMPVGWAVDKSGGPTTDPNQVGALLPFGEHKGYGLSLIDELLAAYIGGSLPTLRSRWNQGHSDEKHTPSLFFQCIHPDALGCGSFARERSQSENVAAVLQDILGPGNEGAKLPGQPEAEAAAQSDRLGGLLFTASEVDAFAAISRETAVPFSAADLQKIEA